MPVARFYESIMVYLDKVNPRQARRFEKAESRGLSRTKRRPPSERGGGAASAFPSMTLRNITQRMTATSRHHDWPPHGGAHGRCLLMALKQNVEGGMRENVGSDGNWVVGRARRCIG
jgi:hypothetical protein